MRRGQDRAGGRGHRRTGRRAAGGPFQPGHCAGRRADPSRHVGPDQGGRRRAADPFPAGRTCRGGRAGPGRRPGRPHRPDERAAPRISARRGAGSDRGPTVRRRAISAAGPPGEHLRAVLCGRARLGVGSGRPIARRQPRGSGWCSALAGRHLSWQPEHAENPAGGQRSDRAGDADQRTTTTDSDRPCTATECCPTRRDLGEGGRKRRFRHHLLLRARHRRDRRPTGSRRDAHPARRARRDRRRHCRAHPRSADRSRRGSGDVHRGHRVRPRRDPAGHRARWPERRMVDRADGAGPERGHCSVERRTHPGQGLRAADGDALPRSGLQRGSAAGHR